MSCHVKKLRYGYTYPEQASIHVGQHLVLTLIDPKGERAYRPSPQL